MAMEDLRKFIKLNHEVLGYLTSFPPFFVVVQFSLRFRSRLDIFEPLVQCNVIVARQKNGQALVFRAGTQHQVFFTCRDTQPLISWRRRALDAAEGSLSGI